MSRPEKQETPTPQNTGLPRPTEDARLLFLVSQIPGVIWCTDTDFVITYSMGGALDVFGLQPHQLEGTNLIDYVGSTSDDPTPINAFHRALNGESTGYEMQYLHRYFRARVEPLRDSDGRITGTIGIALDVTEIKRTEIELEQSLSLLRATLESTVDGILVVDEDGKWAGFNHRFVEMWSIPDTLVSSRDEALLLAYVLDQLIDPDGFIRKTKELYADAEAESFDTLEFKDGRLFERFSKPQRISGKSVGRVWSFSDVTERRNSERKLDQSVSLLRATLESTADGILVVGNDRTITSFNQRFLDLWNVPESLLETRNDIEALKFVLDQLSDPDEFLSRVQVLYDQPEMESYDVVSFKDGRVFERYSRPQKIAGQSVGRVWSFRDVTEQKRSEEALRQSEERYALAVRGANDGLWDWDIKNDEVYFSPRWKSMLGLGEDEIGNSVDEWFRRVHPDDIDRLKAEIAAHLEVLSPHFQNEHRILHRDGSFRWMLSRGLAVRSPSGRAYRLVGSQADITDRKTAEERLMHEAIHDLLTGLPNRALFSDLLSRSLGRAKRKEDYRFAVLFLDLDRFKVINDSLGHMIGDQFLVAIARRLETCLRPGDTVARLGGDEFTVLVEDVQDVSDATRVADRIQEELRQPFILNGHEVFTTTSIGIALSATGYDRPEELLRDADTAMYRAKAAGKATHQVFDTAMHSKAVAQLQLETSLRRALERHEFRLYYQPTISLKTGRLTGFEALVRWQHPEQGIIVPTEFIPNAEETGLILPLGKWVMREACLQMRNWQRQFRTDLTISVNLSSKQFLQADLVEQVAELLQEMTLEPHSLMLEITESTIMENPDSATTMLERLRDLNVQVHIDDFGTGYSSLSYLHRFPIDALKIDRSFVSRMGIGDENLEIVRTIINLARNLGMEVIAEGVESAEQVAQLKALKCLYAQGYHFSKPVERNVAQVLIAAKPQW